MTVDIIHNIHSLILIGGPYAKIVLRVTMNNYLAEYYTSSELVRIVDLAKRRMIDYGIEEYSNQDQKLFKKLQNMQTTKANRKFL